ncbi:hypothetical protein D1815_04190 [Aquimarina sp. AD1]|uniref:hypothetical protein n=1 Tax=Aquimarina sp. (strain AD1) TaxID=1714848 RepID=UPI000E4EF2FE|nr:hypothetical protein [Aquimarina sp. AD1]AXT54993.1 hypothetical protein D1815_04190 [Aquimarina sp. AD1]RKN18431.1 hypothetical protein D7035_14345 [Aquimarina sp. AD1]
MKNKEDELLSVQYRIEKSGMKQQKLEDRLVSISKELKRSKRNSIIFMILFFLVVIGMSFTMYYLNQDGFNPDSDQAKDTPENIDQIKKMNDSLQEELMKLKTDISDYKEKLGSRVEGNSEISVDSTVVYSIKDTIEDDSKKLKFKKQHCYVKNVFRTNGVIFIEVDYIEYYKGRKAVEKAKENNEAEYDIDKNGDTLYFLYDNYYVSNTNTKLRRLELNDKVRIQSLNQISKGFPLKAFQKIISDNPIMLLEMNDGIVYKITKQKLP